MLPTDFLSRVVAWPGADDAPGWVNLHWQPADGHGMFGRPFKTIHEFLNFFQYAANKPSRYKEIYFCLSTQRETGKPAKSGYFTAHRHSSKAMFLKALWLDVDVKPGNPDKGYATLPEALAAVTAFRQAAGLPAPSALVTTGGGVHVYWISERPLTQAEWRPYAEGLKAEAVRLGLKCDPISADAARVLRVPGSLNNKLPAPRQVELRHLGNDYSFAGPAFMALAAKAPPAALAAKSAAVTVTETFTLPPEFAKGPSPVFAHLDPVNDNIASGIGRNDLPFDPSGLLKNCQHFRDSLNDSGVSQSQGLWMLTGLACTWLDTGRAVFHMLSRGYPTYTPEETDKMYDRKLTDRATHSLGWPACKTLESEGAKCKGCAFYGKVRSPLNLAERVAGQPPPPTPPPEAADVDLPDGYSINEKGMVCEIVEKEDRDGTSTTRYDPLFMSKLRNFRAQGGAHRKFVFETSLDMGRWDKVELNEATDLINEVSITKALRLHGVKPNTKISAKRIITFMTSFMAKLDDFRERQVAVSFGWLRKEGQGEMPIGFAYGGRICLATGAEHPAGYTDHQLEKFYKPTGSDRAWWELFRIVTARHHPALECIIAASFAAPLAYATGLYNGVICAWSPMGGAHKSTSIAVGASIWGSPKLTKERPKSSQKGIIRKLGLLKNLPVFWDEINNNTKMNEVQEILGDVTEGAGGTKLRSDRTIYDYDEWQTLMLVGANKSLSAVIIGNNTGTDAQLQRVFEYRVEKREDTQKSYAIDQLTNALDYNFGHMGVAYSRLLGTNVKRVHALVLETLDKFAAEVHMRSEERFRSAMAVTTYVGAMLGNELGCNFNLSEIWQFLKDEFLKQRMLISTSDVIAGTSSHSLDWLTQFMKTFNDNAVWFTDFPSQSHRPNAAALAQAFIAGVSSQRPRPVHIRLTVSTRTIEISRSKFAEWLKYKEADTASVMDGLFKYLDAKPGRTTLAAGTGVLGGVREHTICIPVPDNSPLQNDLYAHTPPDQRGQVTGTVINMTSWKQ